MIWFLLFFMAYWVLNHFDPTAQPNPSFAQQTPGGPFESYGTFPAMHVVSYEFEGLH